MYNVFSNFVPFIVCHSSFASFNLIGYKVIGRFAFRF